MKLFKQAHIPALALLLLLSGCETVDGLSSAVYCKDNPVGSRSVAFSDNDEFHHKLSCSLRNPTFDEVQVTFDPKFSILDTPERVDQWILKVHASAGSVYRCTTDPDQAEALEIQIGKWVLNEARKQWTRWETFRPAETRNVEVWVSAVDTSTVERVRFASRNGYQKPNRCAPNPISQT